MTKDVTNDCWDGSLLEANEALQEKLAEAVYDAKAWMTKYHIEKELADAATVRADHMKTELDAAQARWLKSEDRVELLLNILAGVYNDTRRY